MVKIVQNESKNLLRRKPSLPLDENIPDKETSQDQVDVKQAISTLPESARLIVMLYYFERYSVKEICALLRLPEGTVHSRLARAREQLRKELPDYASKR
jgi:RNA polymerase sigma-70 factor (ECF subfamily)